ncbi:hypothetical protein [Bhargavaea cecembensis]|uniref:hypothetical protein n=1 Tax=Bhargavaea cecembensis TaxID=394098 RepID=UPI00059053A0|nr:hypothetical protein [Bhargavaea cecembensis]
MDELEKVKEIRERIIGLNESDAKGLLMLTVANVFRVDSGNGTFTSGICIEELKKLYTSIPKAK